LALQESLARSLIEAGRDADAYTQYQKILARWPRNANALINYGLLAHRLGHDQEAVDSWQRAVDADPTQANAQLYLAQSLEQRGEKLAAARHYRAYLASVAAHPTEHRGERATVLAALLKVADADTAANQIAAATKGYTAAITYAEKSGEKTLESLGLAHLADLQEKEGKVAEAAQSYQQALALDAGLSDPQSAAVDWLNYGQFLRRQHQPERLVFACLLTAENLLRGLPGDQRSVVNQARAESAARLGREGLIVRRNFHGIANEAAALSATAFRGITPAQE
jgi:Tfp pilus assembly protein PilF